MQKNIRSNLKLFSLIFIKFGYNLRCHWLKERLLPEYKARRGTVSCHAICQFVQGPTTSPTSLQLLFVNLMAHIFPTLMQRGRLFLF